MEGILNAASEVKELLVHEVDKHLDENNDSSSSSSSSDEDEADPGEKFTRIESAVVELNEKLSSSSSSSSSSSDEEDRDEAAPSEDLTIHSTVHDSVEDSGPVAVPEAESIAESKSEVAAEEDDSYAAYGVESEATQVLEKVVIDESDSSESDVKVLPIEEEEETLVAGSLETGDLVSKETEDSPSENTPIVECGSGSPVEEHTDKLEIPESSTSPVLITTVTHRVRSPTSWMSCCGLFDVLRRDA